MLKIAEELMLKTIAIPNISTGIYGFPKNEAANIAIETVKDHNPIYLKKVIFVCFDDENFQLYKNQLDV